MLDATSSGFLSASASATMSPSGTFFLSILGGSKKYLPFPTLSNVLKKFVSAMYVFILAAVLIYCLIGSFTSPSNSLNGPGISCLTFFISLSNLATLDIAPPKIFSLFSANKLSNSNCTASSDIRGLLFFMYVLALPIISLPSGVFLKVLSHWPLSTLLPYNL